MCFSGENGAYEKDDADEDGHLKYGMLLGMLNVLPSARLVQFLVRQQLGLLPSTFSVESLPIHGRSLTCRVVYGVKLKGKRRGEDGIQQQICGGNHSVILLGRRAERIKMWEWRMKMMLMMELPLPKKNSAE